MAFTCLIVSFGCNTSDLTSGEKQPTITGINPSQVSRGQQNVNGRIQGSNFSGIVAVDLDAGIKIHSTNIISSSELEVIYSVNSDAPTGKRMIRVATAAGTATSGEMLTISDNRAPNAVFSVSPANGAKDTLFTFDASDSNDPDGEITGFSWDFGDGATDSGKQVTHRYNDFGNFKVKLTVRDNNQGASTNEREVSVENAVYPIARFSYSPHFGPISTVFQFDGSGSVDKDGKIVTYSWNFKDGTTVNGKIVKHKFKRVDTFGVELSVTDNSGLKTSLEKEVEVRGKPPIAEFIVSPNRGAVGTVFTYDASESADPDSKIELYAWEFGDGNSRNGKTLTHQYVNPGNYTVELRVTDIHGLTDLETQTISVGTDDGGGGGGGGGGSGPCTQTAPNNGFIFGDVIGVRGNWAIVQLPPGSTCDNSFYRCGDMRKAHTSGRDEFFGIIKDMTDLGNSVFEIYNDCPLNWPPAIGTEVFLYFKPCSANSCP